MSTPASAARSRWLEWQPNPQNFVESSNPEPTKPTKPGFEGFDGSPSAHSPNIEERFVSFVGSVPADSQNMEVEKGPEPAGISWAEWQAAALNKIFDELGTPGPGHTKSKITAAIIEHGMENAAGRLEGSR